MKFINKKAAYPINDPECIANCMRFIVDGLKETDVDSEHAIKAQLLAEEMIVPLIENNAAKGGDIRVQIKKTLGEISINISAKGEEYDFVGGDESLSDAVGDAEVQDVIRSIILRAHGENLKYSYKNGINSVRIIAGKAGVSTVKLTLGALAAGLLFGLFIKLALPAAVCAGICEYMLSPVSTMFMNALKIIIAPVVFFSIVSCISGFSDMSELGRIGAKVMGMYLLTTVIAVVMSFIVTTLLSPGTFGAALSMANTGTVDINGDVDTSLLSTIINIVPDNLLKPFVEADTLQLIFLAVLIGAAVGRIGKYTPVLTELFEACNSLFLTITTMIAKLIPLAVFCSISMMIVNMGGSSLLMMLGYFLTNVFEIFIMLAVYGVLVSVLGRLSPLTFYRKMRESMLTSFTLGSSSAAMPVNLRTCTDKLGVSPKVCNFSIPLGATINMDGTCISLVLAGLYLAKMYGISVSPSAFAPLALTIILLSLGCPGVPGAGLVCLGIVLNQLGVPISAMGLVLAIDPVLDLFDTMSNTTGDVACAVISAHSEGLLDEEVFNDKSIS